VRAQGGLRGGGRGGKMYANELQEP
jgi:hypothetical protein